MSRLIAFVPLVVLAACAGVPADREDSHDEMAVYQRHAGGDEMQVRYSSLRNWWPVGLQAVAFEFNGRRHFLVELSGPCDLELRMASTLRVVASRPNVLSSFDRIEIGNQVCRIRNIRRLDMEAVEQDLQEARGDLPEANPDIVVGVDDQESGGT